MFCSCCTDIQSGASTSELSGGEEKGYETSTEQGKRVEFDDSAAPTTQPPDLAEPTTELQQAAAKKAVSDSPFVNKTVVEKENVAGSPQKSPRSPIKGGVFKPPPKAEPAPAYIPLTLPQADKARRTSAPVTASLAAGAYLMYEKESETLYCLWSTTAQSTALAWLMPVVQVPGHKYNVNKGKQILTKECNNAEKYCQGWISFLKITREYPAKLMLLDNFSSTEAPEVQIFLLETPPDKAGISFAREVKEFNKLYDLVKNVKAVAAVPPSTNTLLKADEEIDSKVFLQKGAGIGAALALSRS